jgi:hypothetical protein
MKGEVVLNDDPYLRTTCPNLDEKRRLYDNDREEEEGQKNIN